MTANTAHRPGWVVFTVMLGTVTVSLNNSALNPAVPVFMNTFDIGPLWAGWLITGFMLSMGVTLPLTGYLGARVGKRRLYLGGLAGFVVGSLMGAAAPSMAWVIVARCVQGIAGGLMIPLSLALIFEVYPKDQRGRATGWWGAAVMLAPALGPAVGGLLLTAFSWPVLFLMNVPVGVIGWLVGYRSLRSPADESVPPFDGLGFVLVSLGVGGLMLALSLLAEATTTGPALALGMAAILCLVAFVRHQLRCDRPLLNLRLFAEPTYRLSVVIVVIQSLGIFATLLLLPILMQTVLAFSVLETSLVLVATAVMSSVFVKIGGHQLDRRGPRNVVSLGLVLTAVSTLALGQLPATVTLSTLLAWTMLRGVGMGLSYMPVTTAGLNTIPDAQVAQATAMNNMLRRVTAGLAIVLISLYFEARRLALLNEGWALEIAGLRATNDVFTVIGLMLLAAVPLALRLPDRPARSEPEASPEPS